MGFWSWLLDGGGEQAAARRGRRAAAARRRSVMTRAFRDINREMLFGGTDMWDHRVATRGQQVVQPCWTTQDPRGCCKKVLSGDRARWDFRRCARDFPGLPRRRAASVPRR